MEIRRLNKRGIEMSFAWIFSLIAGAAILFLAIWGVMRFIGSEREVVDTQTTAKLAILFDPLETSLESGRSSAIEFNNDVRIYDSCYSSGNFGRQEIALASKSRIGKEWDEPGVEQTLQNKYIFSNEIEEGKKFGVFTMPFELPFKISDLVFFSTKPYCFISPPNEIEDEIKNLNLVNIQITDIRGNCSENAESVCFGSSSGCDISVFGYGNKFEEGYVNKDGKTMYYLGPLKYGAIFASPEIYECNIKRLVRLRLAELCRIYQDKIDLIQTRGCSSALSSDLGAMASLAASLETSQDLILLKSQAEDIDKANDAAKCQIF